MGKKEKARRAGNSPVGLVVREWGQTIFGVCLAKGGVIGHALEFRGAWVERLVV